MIKPQDNIPEQEEDSSLIRKDREKENKRPAGSRKGTLDPKEENRLINQFFRTNGFKIVLNKIV